MNGYELTRAWFDFAFENTSKITPNHGILYLFCVEHCNRLGWKKEFGLPTTMAKDAIGIRSYNTYINTLNDLVEWGFIILVEKSKNQYSSNIVALSKFDKTLDNALDKATLKHVTKQRESTIQSISSIDKPKTNKPKTSKQFTPPNIEDVISYFDENGYTSEHATKAFNYYASADWKDGNGKQVKVWKQKMQGVWFREQGKKPPKMTPEQLFMMTQ